MANINWGLVSNLGANIPTEGRGWNKPYDTEGFSKSFQEGMNTLGGLFDRFNREKAIGKMGSDKVSAKEEEIKELEAKLASLQSELETAKENVPSQTGMEILGISGDSTTGKILGLNGVRDYNVDPTETKPLIMRM